MASIQHGAPPDVPKDHWAFPAVDRMFKEGLLKGYPSGVRLDPQSKWNRKWLIPKLVQWNKLGFITDEVRFFNNARGGFDLEQANGYQASVLVYRCWEYVQAHPMDTRAHRTDLIKAISMANAHLKKLGADPQRMIEDLDRPNRPFKGR